MQDSYTKSDLMGALTKLKTPHPREAIAERFAQVLLGLPEGRTLNDTGPLRFALIGAEVLVQTLTDGLDAQDARTALTDALGDRIAEHRDPAAEFIRGLEKALADA